MNQMGKLFEGKVGVVMGVANQHSIASGVSKVLKDMGAEMAFSYLPDESGKMETRVRKVVDQWEPAIVHPCDVSDDDSIKAFFAAVERKYGKIDFFVHSVAFAPLDDLKCRTIDASRSGFLNAMDISVYSFMATAREASKIMKDDGAIVTMSYYGGEKVISGYNLMGLAKSALETATRYAAYELGELGIRVNAISAGPIKTLASSAVGASKMLKMYGDIAPMGRNVERDEVGKTAAYLLSDLASATTGEVLHVDGGYHVMGSPGRALDKWAID